jgi:hypothetical protein
MDSNGLKRSKYLSLSNKPYATAKRKKSDQYHNSHAKNKKKYIVGKIEENAISRIASMIDEKTVMKYNEQ